MGLPVTNGRRRRLDWRLQPDLRDGESRRRAGCLSPAGPPAGELLERHPTKLEARRSRIRQRPANRHQADRHGVARDAQGAPGLVHVGPAKPEPSPSFTAASLVFRIVTPTFIDQNGTGHSISDPSSPSLSPGGAAMHEPRGVGAIHARLDGAQGLPRDMDPRTAAALFTLNEIRPLLPHPGAATSQHPSIDTKSQLLAPCPGLPDSIALEKPPEDRDPWRSMSL